MKYRGNFRLLIAVAMALVAPILALEARAGEKLPDCATLDQASVETQACAAYQTSAPPGCPEVGTKSSEIQRCCSGGGKASAYVRTLTKHECSYMREVMSQNPEALAKIPETYEKCSVELKPKGKSKACSR